MGTQINTSPLSAKDVKRIQETLKQVNLKAPSPDAQALSKVAAGVFKSLSKKKPATTKEGS